MEGDMIFVNIDPVFNIALHALRELCEQRRLVVTNVQCSKLQDGVNSNNDDNANRYIFGGENATLEASALAFGRTASSVFRMVMLDAVQIEEHMWPALGTKSYSRNKGALQFEKLFPDEGQKFKLLGADNQNKALARRYWSAYDHAFPHFLIEGKILAAEQNETVGFSNMMLIFRKSFTEVIEIKTTANARKIGREVKSYVHVLCIRRAIRFDKKNADKAGGAFEHLKKYTQEVKTNDNYLEDIMKMINLEDKTIDDDWHEKFNKISFHKSKTESKTPDEENTDITGEAFERTQQDNNRINKSSESSKSIEDESD